MLQQETIIIITGFIRQYKAYNAKHMFAVIRMLLNKYYTGYTACDHIEYMEFGSHNGWILPHAWTVIIAFQDFTLSEALLFYSVIC